MTQPEQPGRRTVVVGAWSLSRFLMLVAAVCMVIAAFTFCGDLSWGPALAWVAGGLSAWALASVV
jgi:hypothetical protein